MHRTLASLALASIAFAGAASFADDAPMKPHACTSSCTHMDGQMAGHMTGTFMGVKANTGHVTHSTVNGQSVLTLSDDFKVPDAPAPHWQVVDSQGNVYLLQRLMVKGDKLNKSIVVPSYVKDIAKVQIWCAWAETSLGEASFEMAVK
ncbi:MAG: hypothetical protein U0572_17125 [Phycisphaerales bacterium]